MYPVSNWQKFDWSCTNRRQVERVLWRLVPRWGREWNWTRILEERASTTLFRGCSCDPSDSKSQSHRSWWHPSSCSKQEERQHWTECTEYVWRSGKLVNGQRNGRSPYSSHFPRKVTLNSVKTTEQLNGWLWEPGKSSICVIEKNAFKVSHLQVHHITQLLHGLFWKFNYKLFSSYTMAVYRLSY